MNQKERDSLTTLLHQNNDIYIRSYHAKYIGQLLIQNVSITLSIQTTRLKV